MNQWTSLILEMGRFFPCIHGFFHPKYAHMQENMHVLHCPYHQDSLLMACTKCRDIIENFSFTNWHGNEGRNEGVAGYALADLGFFDLVDLKFRLGVYREFSILIM